MLPYFTEEFGNASSRTHQYGWDAEKAVERARKQVARMIGANAKEIVFTSGGTEADNLAVKGVAEANRDRGNHVITVATEHHAVLDACRRLEQQGFRITRLPVDGDGLLDPDAVREAITPETILISVMLANNEIGVLQPIREVGTIAQARGVVLHTDAVQAAGKVPIDVDALQVDLLSLSAHKMYGPKGVGALYVRRRNPRIRIASLFEGGGQEQGIRSGTLNVPGIVGFGAAAEIVLVEQADEASRVGRMRDRLSDELHGRLSGVAINGSRVHRVAHNLNVSFAGVDGDALMLAMNDIAVSSGAACSSAQRQPSHVLTALGLDADRARASLRFGLGRGTTKEEIDYTVEKVTSVVTHLREMLAAAESAQNV
jgi:cysteine desulfurase